MRRLIAPLLAIVAAAILAFPLAAQGTPSRTGACTSGCHPSNSTVTVTARETSNSGVTAMYSVTVSPAGGSGWAVFQGATRLASGSGSAGSFSVPTGASYTVYGVSGGNDSNSVVISPVTSTPPPAQTTTPTTTTVRLSATKITYGASITATGAVNASGTPLSGVPVTLFRMSGATPVSIATTTTGLDGTYRFTVKPTAITTYRVGFAGDTEFAASAASAKVTVVAKMGTPSVPSYRRAYRTFTMRGSVSPNGRVTVRMYRYASGKWSLKKTATVTSVSGVYKVPTKLPRGRYRARATYVGTSKIASASSAYRYFSVK